MMNAKLEEDYINFLRAKQERRLKKIQKIPLSILKPHPQELIKEGFIRQKRKNGGFIMRRKPPTEPHEDGDLKGRRAKQWKFTLKEKLSSLEVKELFLFPFEHIEKAKAKGPLYEKLTGALYNPFTAEVLIFLEKPVGKEWVTAYPFVMKESVSIWVSGKRYFRECMSKYPEHISLDFTYEWDETAKFRKRLIDRLRLQDNQPDNMEIEIEKNLEEGFEEVSKPLSKESSSKGGRRLQEFVGQIAKGLTLEHLFDLCKTEEDTEGIMILTENQGSLQRCEKLAAECSEILSEKYPVYFYRAYEFEDYKKRNQTWKDRMDLIIRNKKKIKELVVLGWNPVAFIEMVEENHSLEAIQEEYIARIADERMRADANQLLFLLKPHLEVAQRTAALKN